jgi:hypothetical protein
MSRCDFQPFAMLKAVLNDRRFNSSNEIKEMIPNVRDELTVDEVQSVFYN